MPLARRHTLVVGILLGSLALALAGSASAQIVVNGQLGTVPGAETLALTLSAFDTNTVQGTFSGVLDVEISMVEDPTYGWVVSDAEVVGGQLQAADQMLTVNFGAVSATATSNSLGLRPMPTFSFTPVAAGTSQLTITGGDVFYNAGTVSLSGAAGAQPISESANFGLFPVTAPLDGEFGGSAVVSVLPSGGYEVELSLPVETSAMLAQSPIAVMLSLEGSIILSGELAVAPPIPTLVTPAGAFLLILALAAAGMLLLLRRSATRVS
jgi:hypothetical protein